MRPVENEVHGDRGRKTIVLLPPLAGSSELFAPFRDRLAEHHRVVTLELPGMGDLKAEWPMASTPSLARSALTACRAHDIHGATLFGISLGGMIAQWMAIEDRDQRFDSLVLASTAARGRDARFSLARVVALGRAMLARDPHAEVGLLLSARVRDGDTELASRMTAAMRDHHHDRKELIGLALVAARHDAAAALARVSIPTLVISGARDRVFDAAAQIDLAERLHARHEVIDGAGHDVTLDAPGETARLVLSCLDRDASRRQ
ncbi:alpha/beta hydrolase [soil metagenome]